MPNESLMAVDAVVAEEAVTSLPDNLEKESWEGLAEAARGAALSRKGFKMASGAWEALDGDMKAQQAEEATKKAEAKVEAGKRAEAKVKADREKFEKAKAMEKKAEKVRKDASKEAQSKID